MSLNEDEDIWNSVIERHWRNSNISDYQKEKVIEAMIFLKQELGSEFLRPGPLSKKYPLTTREMLSHPNHPIYNMIVFVSTWNINGIINLADQLKEIKLHCVNYEGIINKLRNKERYLEGLSILNASYRFCRVGFDIEVEPTIGNKMPDLQLVDRENGTKILVELTVLGDSRYSMASTENAIRVSECIEKNGQGIQGDIKIHTLLTEVDLDIVTKSMIETMSEVRSTKQKKSLVIDNKFEFVAMPREGQGGGININGPPYLDSGVWRIIGRIKEKYKGLSQQYPKIIILHSNFTLVVYPEPFINELGKVVSGFPELLFVVVINSYITAMEPGDIKKNYGQHKFVKTFKEGNTERDFIVVNKSCAITLPDATIKKLYAGYE